MYVGRENQRTGQQAACLAHVFHAQTIQEDKVDFMNS